MKLISHFLLKPYYNRIKLGEGGLVVFNLFNSIYAHKEVKIVTIEFLTSFLAMCLLYGYNDYSDRYADVNNPKKDQAFVHMLIQNEKFYLFFNVFGFLLFMLVLLLLGSRTKLLIALTLFTVNYLYSNRLKSIPYVDIFTVMIWGGLFTMLSGKFQPMLFCIASVMTGIAHLFQMVTDKTTDIINNVHTSIVAIPGSEVPFLTGLCVILGTLIFHPLGIVWAATGLLPIIVYLFSKRVTLSWHISRAYFFICWLNLLFVYYGGI